MQQPTSLQNDASLSSSPPQFAKSVKGFSMKLLAISKKGSSLTIFGFVYTVNQDVMDVMQTLKSNLKFEAKEHIYGSTFLFNLLVFAM